MEENVALDSSKQKKFVKSIRGIKKLLKKNELKPPEEQQQIEPKVKKAKRKISKRGLVYLSHIPHGFYEHQMTEYFKQFGGVTNARVIRSKRTGRSKGHAFVEFRQPAVAEIVAETMNNYLMGKRLIKAAYIPPEKQRLYAMRKQWNTVHNPSAEYRLKQKKAYNADLTQESHLKKARKMLANLRKTKQNLSKLGINYDFFTPVDIPEALIEIKQEKEEPVKTDILVKTESKKGKKASVNNDIVKYEPEVKAKHKVKGEAAPPKVEKKNNKAKKANSQEVKDNIKDDQKEVKLKKAGGVKPLEDFIKVQNDSDSDDDSSVAFDSDEYEKMLENESDSAPSLEVDETLDSTGSHESVIDFPPKKIKEKAASKEVKSAQLNKNKKFKQTEKKKNTSPKRKAVSTVTFTSKKPKFEKQDKKIPIKKQSKKKK